MSACLLALLEVHLWPCNFFSMEAFVGKGIESLCVCSRKGVCLLLLIWWKLAAFRNLGQNLFFFFLIFLSSLERIQERTWCEVRFLMFSMHFLYFLSNNLLSNDDHDDNGWHPFSSCGYVVYWILISLMLLMLAPSFYGQVNWVTGTFNNVPVIIQIINGIYRFRPKHSDFKTSSYLDVMPPPLLELGITVIESTKTYGTLIMGQVLN